MDLLQSWLPRIFRTTDIPVPKEDYFGPTENKLWLPTELIIKIFNYCTRDGRQTTKVFKLAQINWKWRRLCFDNLRHYSLTNTSPPPSVGIDPYIDPDTASWRLSTKLNPLLNYRIYGIGSSVSPMISTPEAYFLAHMPGLITLHVKRTVTPHVNIGRRLLGLRELWGLHVDALSKSVVSEETLMQCTQLQQLSVGSCVKPFDMGPVLHCLTQLTDLRINSTMLHSDCRELQRLPYLRRLDMVFEGWCDNQHPPPNTGFILLLPPTNVITKLNINSKQHVVTLDVDHLTELTMLYLAGSCLLVYRDEINDVLPNVEILSFFDINHIIWENMQWMMPIVGAHVTSVSMIKATDKHIIETLVTALPYFIVLEQLSIIRCNIWYYAPSGPPSPSMDLSCLAATLHTLEITHARNLMTTTPPMMGLAALTQLTSLNVEHSALKLSTLKSLTNLGVLIRT